MESVSFSYNGSNQCVATITNAVPTKEYELFVGDPNSTGDIQTAVGTTLVLTTSDIGGYAADQSFECEVSITSSSEKVGVTVLQGGYSGEYAFASAWDYDGVNTFTVRGVFPVGLTVYFSAATPSAGGNLTFVGTGFFQTVVNDVSVTGTPVVGDPDNVYGYVTEDSMGIPFFTNRLFVPDEAGSGFSGNPSSGTQYQRIYGWRINISDDALETVDPMLTSPQGF